MSVITVLVIVFSMLAALDRIIGGRFGIGKEFEKGFLLLGNMALSVIGMIVIAPFIADIMSPIFDVFYNTFKIDPSIISATLFANDMGGAALSVEISRNNEIGMFNALVVSSMMGATMSFSIPYALGVVKRDIHRELFLGILCGIVTIPIGCIVSGLILGLSFAVVIFNLLPLIVFAVVIMLGLLFVPNFCIKAFSVFEKIMRTVITIGLAVGVFEFLTGYEILPGITPIEEAADVCFNAAIVMSGTFPLIYIVSILLKKPLNKFGKLLKINDVAATGFFSSIATNVTTFQMMNDMDKKGVLLNAAFSVSGSFVFASHLAFTMAFNADYVPVMITGKLISGVFGLLLAVLLFKRLCVKESK